MDDHPTTPYTYTGNSPTVTNASQLDHWSSLNTRPADRWAKPWSSLRQPLYAVLLMTIAHVTVAILGIVNNSLVIWIIYRRTKMRTVTNCFLVNLALADILVCVFVLPVTLLHNVYTEWWLGWFICKTIPYLQGVSVSASVNTLAGVALERYMAIFYPKTRKMSPRTASLFVASIWVFPAALFTPWLVVYQLKVYRVSEFNYTACHADWSSPRLSVAFVLTVFLTCYVLPLTIIGFLYLHIGLKVWNRRFGGLLGSTAGRNAARSRIRILKMLVVVVLLFFASWLPLYSVKFRVFFGAPLKTPERAVIVKYLTPLAQWLGASNSCVNPFVYCYFSPSFRREIRGVLTGCHRRVI